MLFRVTAEKPSSSATRRRSSGMDLGVALEHFHVRQQRVPGEDRLGPLEVGVGGHDDPALFVGQGDEGPLEVADQPEQLVDGLARPQPQVHGHLVVAAAAGVELPPGLADTIDQGRLDDHVDVLQLRPELELAGLDVGGDALQAADDRAQLAPRQHADLAQHPGVGDRAGHVVAAQGGIHVDRRQQPAGGGVRIAAEAMLPGLLRTLGLLGHRHFLAPDIIGGGRRQAKDARDTNTATARGPVGTPRGSPRHGAAFFSPGRLGLSDRPRGL